MQKDDFIYVAHMLDLARKVLDKTQGLDRWQYDADENLRLALAHLIQTIGEAARRVSTEFRAAHSAILWNQIVGMRHKVVHDYLDVDYDLVWEVAVVDIPVLIESLRQILPPDVINSSTG